MCNSILSNESRRNAPNAKATIYRSNAHLFGFGDVPQEFGFQQDKVAAEG